ncbi:hypothetical protein THUN1379_10910 [Paludibacterium sp. THUN1379]|uniref:hypothetical protein n=1 Tax=Paludibacterium sp. THUN1379 TaxID=3112107 RepID=UPI00308B8364|nr:hypothetical protein THUN1379_10910 [Paludibacterium sp. THUN1379]
MRRLRHCLFFLAAVLLCSWLRLYDFATDIGHSLYKHGFSPTGWLAVQSDFAKFRRFYTGPPTDAEVIAFWTRHRQQLAQMVALDLAGHCTQGIPLEPYDACELIGRQIGVHFIRMYWLPNSIYAQSHNCPRGCYMWLFTLPYYESDWWRNTNSQIASWRKRLVYIPPLLPPASVGVDDFYPAERDQAMRLECQYQSTALDRPLPEQLAATYPQEVCAFRPLGDGWYLLLEPHYTLP